MARPQSPLSETHPEIAREAHGWDPSTLTPGSGQSREWACQLGHIWSASVINRVKGTGCPYCVGKKVWPGFNDLASQFPEIAKEADGWDPTKVMYGTNKSLQWRCTRGDVWQARVSSRTSGGYGCPYCSGRRARSGDTDLATTHPHLARDADGWDPSKVSKGSNKVLPWKCAHGHHYRAVVNDRTKGNGCPYCSGHKVSVGETDLATLRPDLAAEADGWDPSQVTSGSSIAKAWRCSKGHTWKAKVSTRVGAGNDCPYCAGRYVWPGFNDVATVHPDLAREADGWDPSQTAAGTNKALAWRCPKGHRYKKSPAIRGRGGGCPYCSGHAVLPGDNDLATLRPDVASQALGWDPTTVTISSAKIRRWQCNLGHDWSARVFTRTQQNTGCPYCAGQSAWSGFNDLATTHPEIAAQASGWDPSTVTAGSNKRRKWHCDLGHEWTVNVASRVGGSGCPSCAKSGFDPNLPGWLYLFEHELWGLQQVGITNVPDQRLATHESRGWRRLDLRGPMPGDVAKEWEQSILRSIRKRGVKTGPKHIAGKFDGYTEAWMQDDLPAKSLKSLMDMVHEDES